MSSLPEAVHPRRFGAISGPAWRVGVAHFVDHGCGVLAERDASPVSTEPYGVRRGFGGRLSPSEARTGAEPPPNVQAL